MSSAGLPKACTLVSSKAPGAGSPCFIYSTIICLSSPAVPVPRVSLPLLSRAVRRAQLQSFGTSRSSVQSCFLCLNSSPDFLLRIPQTYPIRVCFPLPVIWTACSYLMLCSPHSCLILISPVSLRGNSPLLPIDGCATCLLHLSPARLLSPPAFSLLCLESIITESFNLIFFSYELFFFFFVLCGCLEMLLLLISYVY